MNYNTLNIFSDASVLGKVDVVKRNRVCAGAVAIVNGCRDREYHTILERSTNNYGELSAIFLAIQLAALYRDDYSEINIFSDSNISVNGLREWIYNWFSHIGPDGVLYSSNGAPVANQIIIKCIYDFVINTFDPNRHRIKIHHCKGHVNTSSKASIANAINCFRRNFKYPLEGDYTNIIMDIQKWNNYIDQSTRASLIRMQYGVEYIPDMAEYAPALFDDRLIYLSYANIIPRNL